jgi:Pyruvate/2-oxoglutarate dehydrogenase complex, dihydrolipoamide acyltransferase (E2) component, and related enzymes
VTDCTIDKLIALRKQLKEDGVKLSVNDFVIKAVALALQQCPQVNALYKGEEVGYYCQHKLTFCFLVYPKDSPLFVPTSTFAQNLEMVLFIYPSCSPDFLFQN